MKELIYEYHIFKLRKYELDRKSKIIAVIHTTYAVVKRKPEKKISTMLH